MPDSLFYTLVPTGFGAVGLAWSAAGIARVLLPEGDERRTAARVGRDAVPVEPGGTAAEAAALLQRYFAGEAVDFSDILVAPGGSEFERQVYARARRVPWGQVTTYGAIAATLGGPAVARAVGQALGANPTPIVVPCHRVLASGGRLGGFSAHGGRVTKQRLLELERAPVQLALL